MADIPGSPPQKKRRDFLNVAIAGAATAFGAAAAYPAFALLQPVRRPTSRSAPAGKADAFEVGTSRTVLLGQSPALVLRLPDGKFRAYVAVCTHLDCVVHYSAARHRIECPCHAGVFDLNGKNIAGPPPRPLTELEVELVEGQVMVRGHG